MPEHPSARLLRDFHDRQNEFYAGADQAPAAALLTADVVWHVPGRSAIAGDHRGREEVLRYFTTRRDLAQSTFRITVRDVLASDDRAVLFAGGEVQRGGAPATWETVSVFRIAGGLIAECWVLPYDLYAFDAVWA